MTTSTSTTTISSAIEPILTLLEGAGELISADRAADAALDVRLANADNAPLVAASDALLREAGNDGRSVVTPDDVRNVFKDWL